MQFLPELYRLLQAWLKQDRIRCAPGIGKLLSLKASDQLLILGALYQVKERTEAIRPASLVVTYQLTEIEQEMPAQLSLAIDLARPTSGVLKLAQLSSTIEIFYQDVTILGPMHRIS